VAGVFHKDAGFAASGAGYVVNHQRMFLDRKNLFIVEPAY
jgi:hypothetical protein